MRRNYGALTNDTYAVAFLISEIAGQLQADGRDIARQLRGAGSKSYLIACTGWGAEEDVLSALAAGFDEHWLKPFEVAQMRHWLDMHMPTR
jgi:CheY-like chemotaxis protein